MVDHNASRKAASPTGAYLARAEGTSCSTLKVATNYCEARRTEPLKTIRQSGGYNASRELNRGLDCECLRHEREYVAGCYQLLRGPLNRANFTDVFQM